MKKPLFTEREDIKPLKNQLKTEAVEQPNTAGVGMGIKKGQLQQVRLQHNAITTHSSENSVSEAGWVVFQYIMKDQKHPRSATKQLLLAKQYQRTAVISKSRDTSGQQPKELFHVPTLLKDISCPAKTDNKAL